MSFSVDVDTAIVGCIMNNHQYDISTTLPKNIN
jgi:hypothetical protein